MTNPDPRPEDTRLQPDPSLQLSTGRANAAQIISTAIGVIAIIFLVLYGINNQRDETERETASAPAAQTTGAAPPATQQESSKQQASQGAAQQGGQGNQQQGNQPGQQRQGSNQGDRANQAPGQAQSNQGPGAAGPRNTTGAAPSPPAGAPESAQSSAGGSRPGR
jgi:preprotein translocase subunit SecF